MSPTVTIDSLSTSIGRIALAGTGSLLEMTNDSGKVMTPFMIDYDYTIPTTVGGERGNR